MDISTLQSFANDFWTWLWQDPDGQRIGLGLAVSATLLTVVVAGKTLKALAERCKRWPALAVLTLAAFYGVVVGLELDPTGWAVAGMIATAAFLVVALLSAKSQDKAAKGKPQPA